MGKNEVRADRRYTKDHEWAKREGVEVLVGVSAYAVDQLGDITLVNLDARPGESIEAGKPFGTVESVKTLADLFAPVSGRVLRVNSVLENAPETLNDDCYGAGWLVAIEPAKPEEYDALMDAEAYTAFLATTDH
ncbi:MAG: glycine cleavage system protein GcvH [Myxococcales bacterium]|nr:glycine cleavage system protein GcvH [Myxococcales bacterium]